MIIIGESCFRRISGSPFASRNVGFFPIKDSNYCYGSKCRNLLTFDLQDDVILINSEDVLGHTGVFTAVVSLSLAQHQSAVVVNDVRVSVQGAGATVFEPETQRRRLEPLKSIPPPCFPLSFHSPGNLWDGRPKGGAVDENAVIFDDLVDFVGRSQHSGRLGCGSNYRSVMTPQK